jgi:hypothetical protein
MQDTGSFAFALSHLDLVFVELLQEPAIQDFLHSLFLGIGQGA